MNHLRLSDGALVNAPSSLWQVEWSVIALHWRVPGVDEVVCAFVWRDGIEGGADAFPGFLD